jgi:hypothetical protein
VLRQVRPLADGHSAALDRGLDHLVVMRETQPSGTLDVTQIQGAEPLLPVVPRPSVEHRLEVEQHVLRQVGLRSQWPRRIGKQLRCTDRKLVILEQLVLGLGRRAPLHKAQSEVDVFAFEVERIVAGGKAHVDLRVLLREPRQARHQPGRCQRHRRGDRQCPPGAGQAHRRVVDQRQRLVDGAVKLLSGLRQFECAVDATEQRLSQLLLERLDLAADRRLRHEEFLRRAREAQMSGCGTKAAQQVERQAGNSPAVHALSSCDHSEKLVCGAPSAARTMHAH